MAPDVGAANGDVSAYVGYIAAIFRVFLAWLLDDLASCQQEHSAEAACRAFLNRLRRSIGRLHMHRGCLIGRGVPLMRLALIRALDGAGLVSWRLAQCWSEARLAQWANPKIRRALTSALSAAELQQWWEASKHHDQVMFEAQERRLMHHQQAAQLQAAQQQIDRRWHQQLMWV